MSDLIPAQFYTPVFHFLILIIILSLLTKMVQKDYSLNNTSKKNNIIWMLLLFVIFFMGLRPLVGGGFTDMYQYERDYQDFVLGLDIKNNKDLLWSLYMKFCSSFMSSRIFFFICGVLYIIPLHIASKKWLGKNQYVLLLMFIASYSFWPYGTNGIRNGIATSMFILGLSFYNKKYLQYSLFIIAFYIHASVIIPIAGFIISLFFKKPKYYLFAWMLCVVLSLAFGGLFETYFSEIGFEDNRTNYLTQGNINNDNFSSTGFRWDFLIYSFTAVFAGYYFLVKKKFNDKVYLQLFSIFITANAFWILIIRANFSNRIAYLSWFLMAAIIFYPLLKENLIKNQKFTLVKMIIIYFGFTFIMSLITYL